MVFSRFYKSLVLVGITAVVFFSASILFAASNCGSYTASTPPPDRYGAAYNVFSPSQMLFKVSCDTVGATLQIGGTGHVVYEKGYYYDGEWKEFKMVGSRYGDLRSVYLNGPVDHVISENLLRDGINYVVTYVCINQSNQWKCGCSDTTCAVGKWQLQSFAKKDIPKPQGCLSTTDKPLGCWCNEATQCTSNICEVSYSGFHACQATRPVGVGTQYLPPATIGVPYSASLNLGSYPEYTEWTIQKEPNSPLPPNELWFNRDGMPLSRVEGIALSPGLSEGNSSVFPLYGKRVSDSVTGVLNVIIQKVDWAQCSVTADCANLQVQTPVECRNNECRYTWDSSE